MKLATWNVNSIRARAEQVLAWTRANAPDVLCLQETKVVDADFPRAAFEAAGYQTAICGQASYNGVAICARAELHDVTCGIPDGIDDPQARLIAATIDGVRVISSYVPNGESVTSPKFKYKLNWLDRLRAHLEKDHSPTEPLILCGDFNVAPEPIDVHDPAAWDGKVLFHPDERAALARIKESLGLVDVFRAQHPEPGLYSWWDYRMLGFPRNKGLRIDHVYATAPLAARARSSHIDREARKGKGTSDHAPVIVEFGHSSPR